jgi:hypothetical protein
MRVLGLVSLVAVIFLLSFRFLLHQQVLVGKYFSLIATSYTLLPLLTTRTVLLRT